MSRKEIVFFDIDGTLVTKNNNISRTTIQAIKQLQKNGIKPILATGRPPVLIDAISRKLDINSYIAMHGQYIVHEGEVIYSNPIEEAKIEQALQIAEKRQDGVILYSENELIIGPNTLLNKKSIYINYFRGLFQSIPEKLKVNIMARFLSEMPEKSVYQDKDIFMVGIKIDRDAEDVYIKNMNQLSFTRADKSSLAIINEDISKASAVRKLLDVLGVEAENTVAFGDGLNDLEMLKYVGTGVAMGNGFSELKAAADFVTDSVFEDGVVKALKEMKLI